ncbi:segregation/condensation protein A [bacterium]|nr:segregation/condensation protein A [bacterium]
MYTVKLSQFEGPLDLLLHLIEKEKLDITEISLAEVADKYLAYIEEAEEISPDELADFLVVAARLLLIKSSFLIPGEIEKEEYTDLANQLKIYREFLLASKKIQKIYNQKKYAFSRNKFPIVIKTKFPENIKISPNILKKYFESLTNLLLSQIKLRQGTIKKVISLKEKINQLLEKIKNLEKIKFSELVDKPLREEIVITFLATLDLVKKRVIQIEQKCLFGDIIIRKLN